MTSKRTPVRFNGTIWKGNEPVATCNVRAVRIELLGSDAFTHIEPKIEDLSEPLQDGSYEVEYNNEKLRVRLTKGHWLSDEH